MKRLVLIIISLIVTCCQLQAKDKEGTIAFGKTSFNFGTFQKSTIRKCVFPFKNTGNAPISISAAEATCNCTTATYTKSPIMPGKTGYVTIYYSGSTVLDISVRRLTSGQQPVMDLSDW